MSLEKLGVESHIWKIIYSTNIYSMMSSVSTENYSCKSSLHIYTVCTVKSSPMCLCRHNKRCLEIILNVMFSLSLNFLRHLLPWRTVLSAPLSTFLPNWDRPVTCWPSCHARSTSVSSTTLVWSPQQRAVQSSEQFQRVTCMFMPSTQWFKQGSALILDTQLDTYLLHFITALSLNSKEDLVTIKNNPRTRQVEKRE